MSFLVGSQCAELVAFVLKVFDDGGMMMDG